MDGSLGILFLHLYLLFIEIVSYASCVQIIFICLILIFIVLFRIESLDVCTLLFVLGDSYLRLDSRYFKFSNPCEGFSYQVFLSCFGTHHMVRNPLFSSLCNDKTLEKVKFFAW